MHLYNEFIVSLRFTMASAESVRWGVAQYYNLNSAWTLHLNSFEILYSSVMQF